jgi:hypothetical protein
MHDIFLFMVIPVTAVILYLLSKVIDVLGECWHKWDKWIVWQTEHAYCQGRKCLKCGQQQIIQVEKVKDGHPNN